MANPTQTTLILSGALPHPSTVAVPGTDLGALPFDGLYDTITDIAYLQFSVTTTNNLPAAGVGVLGYTIEQKRGGVTVATISGDANAATSSAIVSTAPPTVPTSTQVASKSVASKSRSVTTQWLVLPIRAGDTLTLTWDATVQSYLITAISIALFGGAKPASTLNTSPRGDLAYFIGHVSASADVVQTGFYIPSSSGWVETVAAFSTGSSLQPVSSLARVGTADYPLYLVDKIYTYALDSWGSKKWQLFSGGQRLNRAPMPQSAGVVVPDLHVLSLISNGNSAGNANSTSQTIKLKPRVVMNIPAGSSQRVMTGMARDWGGSIWILRRKLDPTYLTSNPLYYRGKWGAAKVPRLWFEGIDYRDDTLVVEGVTVWDDLNYLFADWCVAIDGSIVSAAVHIASDGTVTLRTKTAPSFDGPWPEDSEALTVLTGTAFARPLRLFCLTNGDLFLLTNGTLKSTDKGQTWVSAV